MTIDQQFRTGVSHHQAGRAAEAERIYRNILAQLPNHPDALHLLGVLAAQSGRFDTAAQLIQRAISIHPTNPFYHSDLGNAFRCQGQLDEAIASYRQALALDSELAEVHNNLANALAAKGLLNEAANAERQAIRLKPNVAEAHHNLGILLHRSGRPDDAIVAYHEAIRLKPSHPMAHNDLGMALVTVGRLDEALSSYREAMRLAPNDPVAHSNLIIGLHYHPSCDGKAIYEELRRWNQQHAEPRKKFVRPHGNDRDPDRRLRIGYVSPDFRHSVLGSNLLPLLREHQREQMHIFCYANVSRPDELTDQFRLCAHMWRNIVGMSDPDAAELIRKDEIDILVDLALHTEGNRLGVFAYKPAPVQVTYLGYCSSTGLKTIDYRLSDQYLDPLDADLSIYSEATIRLPDTYWCYAPAAKAPEPSPPPAASNGYVTFGCQCNFAKVSMSSLDLWVEILLEVPSSRLIIHSRLGAHLETVRERFAGRNIAADRLEFVGGQSWIQYMQTYGRIDIAFDPFPWGGGITSCDALWMGVPVISLIGQTAVGRGGNSILHTIGVPELVADTPRRYLQTAVELVSDLPRLSELRRTLRPRMQASPLTDVPSFTRNLEAVYRQIWQSWCSSEK